MKIKANKTIFCETIFDGSFTDSYIVEKKLKDYESFEIFFQNNDGHYSYSKVEYGTTDVLLFTLRFAYSKLYVKTARLSIDYTNNKFSLSEQRECNFTSSENTIGTSETEKIFITKIVGYF